MNIDLTKEEWNVLLNAAALAPYAQIAPLLHKISGQFAEAPEGMPEKRSPAGNGRATRTHQEG